MVMTPGEALQQGEKTLTDRLKLRRLGCDEQLLDKIESYGDMIMDYAVKQNKAIQKMKEAMKRC